MQKHNERASAPSLIIKRSRLRSSCGGWLNRRVFVCLCFVCIQKGERRRATTKGKRTREDHVTVEHREEREGGRGGPKGIVPRRRDRRESSRETDADPPWCRKVRERARRTGCVCPVYFFAASACCCFFIFLIRPCLYERMSPLWMAEKQRQSKIEKQASQTDAQNKPRGP